MNIKIARETAGISRRELSEWLGIPMRTLEDWESGRRKPAPWAEKLIIDKIKAGKHDGEKN